MFKIFKERAFVYCSVFLILFAVLLLYFYLNLNTSGFLSFSDGAKFADIARNIVNADGYKTNFSFFSPKIFVHAKGEFFSARGAPLAMSYSMAFMFSLFGVSDFSVIATSGIFYLALVIATFLLGRYLFGNLVGVLSAITVAANVNFLDYATSGASEPLFIFAAVITAYLILLKKRWANFAAFFGLLLLYFTRPQGALFIGGLAFMWLILNYSLKFAFLIVSVIAFGGWLIDKYVLYPLSWKLPVYPIVTRGIQAFFQYSSNFAVSDALRGAVARNVTLLGLGRKAFWNLYNFYKLLPQIASPYMWGLFLIGVIKMGKKKNENTFKLTTVLLVTGNFLLVALTIPFFRYLHPVVPFVYIIATATLVWIVEKMAKDIRFKIYDLRINISKQKFVNLASLILILVFVVGQTLGVIFLDSRFKAARTNKGKPPVYVVLSWILRNNTSPDDVIVTNLDTWGTWYGERKTVWFPLRPEQLDFEEFEKTPFDAIYMTSYLMDDENYYMGDEWRQIFSNPEDPANEFIAENYRLKEVFSVEAEDTYEQQGARAVLLVKRENP